MAKTQKQRGMHLERCYKLAATLADGGVLDRNRISRTLGISPANADRHLRAIQNTMNVSRTQGRDGLTTLSASRGTTRTLPSASVVAACFGASLARLFQGSAFERRLRDIVGHVLDSVKDAPKYRDRERQFIFISRGGERALRQDGDVTLDEIVDAILDRRMLRVTYVRFSGAIETVRLKPVSLAVHEHQLYLLGFEDNELRIVRFSRIKKALKLVKQFRYPTLDEYDPNLVFQDSVGVFIHDDESKGIGVRDVKFHLSPRWSSYAETHRWHESQRQTIDKRGVSIMLRVRTCPELESLILGFGEDAVVLEPPELHAKLAKKTAIMARQYKRRRTVRSSTARRRR